MIFHQYCNDLKNGLSQLEIFPCTKISSGLSKHVVAMKPNGLSFKHQKNAVANRVSGFAQTWNQDELLGSTVGEDQQAFQIDQITGDYPMIFS